MDDVIGAAVATIGFSLAALFFVAALWLAWELARNITGVC